MTVLVVGDVVDDISVRPLEAVTAASDTNAEIRRHAGGSAANVAAWLGHLGTPVRFVGRVGAEGVERHRCELEKHGVDVHLAGDPESSTATIVLQLDGAGERTMFVDRGANGALALEDLPSDVWDGVDWLHLTGYTLFDHGTRPVASALLSAARERGIGASVDPSTVSFLRACGGQTFLEWIDGAELIFPNLEEARVLVDARGPQIDLDALAARVPHVVVTLGSMGAAYVSGPDHGGVREQVTAPRIDVADTTGAGDAFAAGFLSAWTRGADPRMSLDAGRTAAERCVSRPGARP